MAVKEVIDELVVQIETDYSKFTNGLKKVDDELEKSSQRALKKLKEFEKLGKKMSISLTLPLALIARASTNMAMEVRESENLFEVSMKGMADAGRDYSEKLRNDLGLNAVEVRKNIATLQTMFNSMELNEQQAYDMATSLAKLSYDMASFRNLKPEEAFLKLQAGISGEAEPLKRLGILLDENTVKQVAYTNGIAKMGAELTQQQKVLARYAAIMQQTKDDQGDLARTLDSPINRMRLWNEKMKEMSTNIGEAFIPAVKDILDIATPLVDTFNSFGEETQKAYVQMGIFVAAIGPAILGLNKLAAAFTFLMANPVVLSLAGIAAVIAAISVEAAKAKDEQAKLNEELRRTNEIRQKGITISQIDQIEKEKDEITQLVKEYEKVLEVKKKLESQQEGETGLFAVQTSNELAEVEQQLLNIEKSLDDLGVSYENAQIRVRAYEEALKDANKEKQRQIELQEIRDAISRDELAVDQQLYNNQRASTTELRKLIEEYQELTSKQKLSVSQRENLVKITNTLKNLLGDEIVVRNSQNEIIGLNIDAINGEVEAIEANVNAQKDAIREKIKDEISFTNTKVNEVVKRIEIEKKYLETLNKLRLPEEVDESNPLLASVARANNRILSNDINKRKNNIAELDSLVNQLKSKKASYEKELISIDDINLSTHDVNYSTNVGVSSNKQQQILDENNRKQQENIREVSRLLREQNKDQLDAIKDEDDALNDAYKNLLGNIRDVRSQRLSDLKEEEETRLELNRKEKEHADNLHSQRLEDIQEEKNRKLDAIQDEIDKINNEANQEDRQEELGEAKSLLALYSQSSTAEGQKKARELAKKIRDIENQERVEGLKDQQASIKEQADNEIEEINKTYEAKLKSFEDTEERIKTHYENMTNQATEYFANQEEGLKQQYDAQTKLIEERQYVIENKNEQMLEAVAEYAKENESIYLKSAEDIIALMKSKEGDYYQSGVDLADKFHQGLMDQLKKIREFETSIGVNLDIPPVPTRNTSSQERAIANKQVEGNKTKVNINYFGDNVFETDTDLVQFSNIQKDNIASTTSQSQ